MNPSKLIVFAVCVVLATLTVAAQEAAAEAEKVVEMEFSIDWMSKYVWRGIPVNDEPVLQPSFTIGAYGFAANWWGNFDTTNGVDGSLSENNFSEHDWTLSYGTEIMDTGLSVEVGAIYYYFPRVEGDSDTTEVYGRLAYDLKTETMDLPDPEIAIYYDVDAVEGAYMSLGLSHSIALESIDPALSLDMGVSVGYATADYNLAYFGIDEAAFNDVTASVGLSYALTEHASVGLTVAASEMLDGDIRDLIDSDPDLDSSNVYYGVNLTLTY